MPLSIVFTNAGTYTIEDDGIRGNNTSVVRDSNGVIIATFVHPTDTLTFSTIVPGVNLTFNVADSFGPANVSVGALGDLAASPDSIVVRQMRTDGFMTLVSRNTIIEGGSDASADVTAAALVLSAVSGVGTAGNALEIQTTFLEAETLTGGINLANFGQVQIGGITPDVSGLDILTSGDLKFSAVGSIFLSDTSGLSTIRGGENSGNVTLTAIGGGADIYAPINHPSIYAGGGGITLDAGRNVWFGPGGANFNNDVFATGDIRITAGADFVLDGTSDVRTGAFGGVVGGSIVITAGRNIELANTTGGLQTIQAFQGDIIFTTGAGAGAFAGGAFIEQASFPGAVSTTNSIILNSDTVVIASGGLNTTGVGSVTIRPVTPGLQVDLGNTGVDLPGAIGLSDAEFDLLFTLNVIIGSADTGNVTFSAPLSPFIVDNLTVHSGNDILFNSSLSLPRALTLRAGDDVYFSPTSSFTSGNEGLTVFVDQAQDDGGAGGLGHLDGPLLVNTTIQLTGNAEADALSGSGANEIFDGRGGADIMAGRGGDDWYFVDNAADGVSEGAADGALDRVFASVSYSLGSGVYVERLTTTNNAGTSAINLSGNELANVIYGNAGSNVIDGRGGADTLIGLGGNDNYFVDSAGDLVIEGAAEGANDRIFASVSYTQGAGVHVERLTTSNNGATTAINLTGNAFANMIYGNAGANVLDGAGGVDMLVGFGGDDWYFVDNPTDNVTESVGEGANDRILSAVSYTMGAGVHVERLTTTNSAGTAAINLTGNELANVIYGNAGGNVLDGKGGSDTLLGLAGQDVFAFTTALGGGNVDTISGFVVVDDRIHVDNAVFAGLAAGALASGAFNTGAAATQADDRIIYNSATGALLFDADGVGGVSGIQFASVSAGLALTAGDFLVV